MSPKTDIDAFVSKLKLDEKSNVTVKSSMLRRHLAFLPSAFVTNSNNSFHRINFSPTQGHTFAPTRSSTPHPNARKCHESCQGKMRWRRRSQQMTSTFSNHFFFSFHLPFFCSKLSKNKSIERAPGSLPHPGFPLFLLPLLTFVLLHASLLFHNPVNNLLNGNAKPDICDFFPFFAWLPTKTGKTCLLLFSFYNYLCHPALPWCCSTFPPKVLV